LKSTTYVKPCAEPAKRLHFFDNQLKNGDDQLVFPSLAEPAKRLHFFDTFNMYFVPVFNFSTAERAKWLHFSLDGSDRAASRRG
jgi:hypothetical protein